MTSPAPAPPRAPSDSARHRGACGASAAQGLSLRRDPCCAGCEGTQARAPAHGRLTRRAAATESDAVALALPAAISNQRDRAEVLWRSGRRRRSPPEGRGAQQKSSSNTPSQLVSIALIRPSSKKKNLIWHRNLLSKRNQRRERRKNIHTGSHARYGFGGRSETQETS